MPYSQDPGHQSTAQPIGENNVMDSEPQEAMNPSLSTIEQKTFFVHATYFFPKTGLLLAGRKVNDGAFSPLEGSEFAFSKFRQTIHFAIGSVISPDYIRASAERTQYPYAVIAPFNAVKNQLAEVSFVDSYVVGDLKFNNSMFLVYPEEEVITDEIHASGIQLVPYDPSQTTISALSQQVIEQSGGWLTTLQHRNFEPCARVTIGNEYVHIGSPTLSFFKPLTEKYKQLSVGGNEVDYVYGNPDSKLLPSIDRLASNLHEAIFNSCFEESKTTIFLLDFLYPAAKEYLHTYFTEHEETVFTNISVEKERLLTIANYQLSLAAEGKDIKNIRHLLYDPEFLMAANSEETLRDFVTKNNLITVARTVMSDMKITLSNFDQFPANQFESLLKTCQEKGIIVTDFAIEEYQLNKNLRDWSMSEDVERRNDLAHSIQETIEAHFYEFLDQPMHVVYCIEQIERYDSSEKKVLEFLETRPMAFLLKTKMGVKNNAEILASSNERTLYSRIITQKISDDSPSQQKALGRIKPLIDIQHLDIKADPVLGSKIDFLNAADVEIRNKQLSLERPILRHISQQVCGALFDSNKPINQIIAKYLTQHHEDRMTVSCDVSRTGALLKQYAPRCFGLASTRPVVLEGQKKQMDGSVAHPAQLASHAPPAIPAAEIAKLREEAMALTRASHKEQAQPEPASQSGGSMLGMSAAEMGKQVALGIASAPYGGFWVLPAAQGQGQEQAAKEAEKEKKKKAAEPALKF